MDACAPGSDGGKRDGYRAVGQHDGHHLQVDQRTQRYQRQQDLQRAGNEGHQPQLHHDLQRATAFLPCNLQLGGVVLQEEAVGLLQQTGEVAGTGDEAKILAAEERQVLHRVLQGAASAKHDRIQQEAARESADPVDGQTVDQT